MSITKQYQTYYGVKLNHWSETWADAEYNEILLKEYPNEYLSTVSNSTVSSITFMYPSLYKNKYYIDGFVEGHFTLYNTSSTTTFTITGYDVTLYRAKDIQNEEEEIGSFSNILDTNNDIAPEGYLTLPIYFNVSQSLVVEDERLLLSLSFVESSASYDYVAFSHWNDSSIPDLQIKIPYAPKG